MVLSYSPSAGSHTVVAAVPRPLLVGERADVWLEQPDSHPVNGAGAPADADGHWDVYHARVIAIVPDAIVLQTQDQSATPPTTEGQPVLIRRAGAEGLAEWSGAVGERELLFGLDYGAMAALHAAPNATIMVTLAAGSAVGRLYQRRRSPRVPLAMEPTRITPLLGASLTAGSIEAQLTDVSANGAGLVTSTPLAGGTTVSLEFTLPGESAPFVVRGRVVEPAVEGALAESAGIALDGDRPPLAPRVRRGIEFIGTAANREALRLAGVVSRLLANES